jgi:hypothetical protein
MKNFVRRFKSSQQVARLESNQRLSAMKTPAETNRVAAPAVTPGDRDANPPSDEQEQQQHPTVEQAQLATTERFVRYDEAFKRSPGCFLGAAIREAGKYCIC